MKNNESLCSWLYQNYVNELFSYGMALGMDRILLQDTIHDIFLHILENENILLEIKNLKFYLLRCLKNRLISIKRKDIYLENIDDLPDNEFSISITGLDIIIDEEEKKAVKTRIEQLLQCLTNRQREAIYLRFMQGFDYEYIGPLLDMTPKAVRNLIYRAIERIREQHLLVCLLLFL